MRGLWETALTPFNGVLLFCVVVLCFCVCVVLACFLLEVELGYKRRAAQSSIDLLWCDGHYHYYWTAGMAQWLGCPTHGWKVTGLSPCRSGGRIFFSRVNFLCWLLFRCPFHPCVAAVACKRPRSFCQKCRWQVTAKRTCTLRMWLCMKWHGAWSYGVHGKRRDSSSFMWHQPCQRCKYTTWVDILKHTVKS